MWYDLLILVFLTMIFCFFSMMLTVNVMFRLFNAMRPEDAKEIKPFEMPKKAPKKTKEELMAEKKAAEEKRKYDIIMSNLEAYDGTEIGQKEVK